MEHLIKILDNNLINKIAAGEVVERPSSIVKEIVENSIDAGATNITIEIKDGGKSLIKITDNGKGIPKSQIKTAFLRHATSKLSDISDLDSLLTLGFRGEALSSISSISQVHMVTKTKDDSIGSSIEIDGGVIVKESEVATLRGTTLSIKNIFFNTPVRRKFLKKDSVEGNYVTEIINKLALSNCQVAFTYINNGSEIFKTVGDNNLKNTAFYIYGKEICKKLIPIEATKDGFSLYGLISLPEISRSNRTYETFFINNRYVKSSIVSSAIEDGYSNKLMKGKFPIFILYLSTPDATVDVNVHPTKLEVRFADEPFIRTFLSSVISKALSEQVLIPSVSIPSQIYSNDLTEKQKTVLDELLANDISVPDTDIVINNVNVDTIPSFDDKHIHSPHNTESNITKGVLMFNEDSSLIDEMLEIDDDSNHSSLNDILFPSSPIMQSIPKNTQKYEPVNPKILHQEKISINRDLFFHNYKVLGQIFGTYWLVEQGDELFIIDQHSAHEKVIYEKLIKEFYSQSVATQELIEPINIAVSPLENTAISQNIDLFNNLGFRIIEVDNNSYDIQAVPFIFKNPANIDYFNELLSILMDKTVDNAYDINVKKIISMSCKQAVKANDRLGFIEAEALIGSLLKLDDPFNCPHGRPTIIKMSKYEIEKLFKRIQN